MNNIKQKLFSNGDEAEYTGNPAKLYYNGVFYEYKLLPGHTRQGYKDGDTILIAERHAVNINNNLHG